MVVQQQHITHTILWSRTTCDCYFLCGPPNREPASLDDGILSMVLGTEQEDEFFEGTLQAISPNSIQDGEKTQVGRGSQREDGNQVGRSSGENMPGHSKTEAHLDFYFVN